MVHGPIIRICLNLRWFNYLVHVYYNIRTEEELRDSIKIFPLFSLICEGREGAGGSRVATSSTGLRLLNGSGVGGSGGVFVLPCTLR